MSLTDHMKPRQGFVEFSKQVLKSPYVIAIYALLGVYSSTVTTGEIYGEGQRLINAGAQLSFVAVQYVAAYFSLGRWVYFWTARNVPIVVSGCALWALIIAPQFLLVGLFQISALSPLELARHYVSDVFLAVLGTLMVLKMFEGRIADALVTERRLCPAWWPVSPDAMGRETEQSALPKRGKVLWVQSQNQYVCVQTDQGEHFVRTSLKDAMLSLHADDGMQVHRSLWIRFDQIRDIFYENGNPRVRTTSGTDFPVSRTHLKALKEQLDARASLNT